MTNPPCACRYPGVPAGGGAAAPPDPPAPGGPAEDRVAAAALQGRPGEEALRQHEEGLQCPTGETPCRPQYVTSSVYFLRLCKQRPIFRMEKNRQHCPNVDKFKPGVHEVIESPCVLCKGL